MKTREGFVTNSSSSSFVIALNGNGSEKTIKTKDELDGYYIEQYGSDGDTITDLIEDSNWIKENYERDLRHIERGKQLYFGSVSTDGDMYEDIERLVNALGAEIEWNGD